MPVNLSNLAELKILHARDKLNDWQICISVTTSIWFVNYSSVHGTAYRPLVCTEYGTESIMMFLDIWKQFEK
jgi:hypothetical protein